MSVFGVQGQIPKSFPVSDGALSSFETAFRTFVAKERARLELEKKFLESLPISDLGSAVSSVTDTLVQFSNAELDKLFERLP